MCDVTMPGYPNNYQLREKRVRYTEEELPLPPAQPSVYEVFQQYLPLDSEQLLTEFQINKNLQTIGQYL